MASSPLSATLVPVSKGNGSHVSSAGLQAPLKTQRRLEQASDSRSCRVLSNLLAAKFRLKANSGKVPPSASPYLRPLSSPDAIQWRSDDGSRLPSANPC